MNRIIMRDCFYIFVFLRVTAGCTLSDKHEQTEVTAYTGGSVLLPCTCNDPKSTAERLRWIYFSTIEFLILEDERYKGRHQLFRESSPTNLSLLISGLRKEDAGDYRCETSRSYKDIKLNIKGCDLVQKGHMIDVTGYSGESVVLPCSCTEIQAKPDYTAWTYNPLNIRSKYIYPDEQSQFHRGKVKLLNKTSPGNLSLLISDLNKEHQGEYQCSIKTQQHVFIRLHVEVKPHITTLYLSTNQPITQAEIFTTQLTTQQPEDSLIKPYVYILMSVFLLILLLVVLILIYCQHRGRTNVKKMLNDGLNLKTDKEDQRELKPDGLTHGQNIKQDESQNELTYSTVVHIKTPATPAHIQTVTAEHTEYASIK